MSSAHPQTARMLGGMLVAAGAVTQPQLTRALDEQRRTRERIGELLIRGGADAESVARTLAQQLRLEYAPPPLVPAAGAERLIDPALAHKLRAVVLRTSERAAVVALADPLDAAALDDLQFRTGRRVQPVVASAAAIDAFHAASADAHAVDALLTRMPARSASTSKEEDVRTLRRASEAAPIVALVELMLARAAERRASDLHVEPGPGGMQVRARIDGVLAPLLEIPQQAANAAVSRLKIIAGLDIAVRLRPQDGRATFTMPSGDVALRVSTLPSLHGEKVVIRVLRAASAAQPLNALGMDTGTEHRIMQLLGMPHGVILVTGPTGSGKTTTLYAALGALDRARRNVITLEDPVEYTLPGVTQVQVQNRAGLTFSTALRATLRQDPDVIMVGEMRDRTTVDTALAAALTGHLVLSTLHTNDAASAATRLCEMKAAPYLVAAALIGVVAQRLARRLCEQCRLRVDSAAGSRFVARGCAHCGGTGFHGRVGVYEVLLADDAVRERILKRAPAYAVREAAVRAGMRTLAQDAARLVSAGITTAEEVAPLLLL